MDQARDVHPVSLMLPGHAELSGGPPPAPPPASRAPSASVREPPAQAAATTTPLVTPSTRTVAPSSSARLMCFPSQTEQRRLPRTSELHKSSRGNSSKREEHAREKSGSPAELRHSRRLLQRHCRTVPHAGRHVLRVMQTPIVPPLRRRPTAARRSKLGARASAPSSRASRSRRPRRCALLTPRANPGSSRVTLSLR